MYNLILRPSGISKTFMAADLFVMCPEGYRAQSTMDNLIGILMKGRVVVACAYNNILKCNLFGVDDIMLMPMKKEEAVAFFNLINALHEKASVIITTNKAPTEWVEVLQDEVLATALLDRLLFHCEVVKLEGSSYRMENRSGFLEKEKEERQ